MDYFIGIDIGTTSAKAVAFSATGDIIAKEDIGYPIIHPNTNYSEQNPEEILEAVIISIDKVTATLDKDNAILISFSAAMHSVLAVDQTGKPLTNCIIWADNRASSIAEQLRDTEKGNIFYHKTGVPIHAMSPLCKLLWLKENNAVVFTTAYKFIGIKEYIFCKLFNKYIIDTGVASGTGFFNMHTLQWDDFILNEAGIHATQLSVVVDTHHKEYLTPESIYYTDSRFRYALAATYIIGSSDGALANLGSGAVNKNAMAISIGTSSAVRMVTTEVFTDHLMRTFCYHLANHNYIIGGASNNGAVVLQWFKDAVLETNETHEQLFQRAETITAGSTGLIFIPYLLGERAPVWNSHASGVFFGLNITHKRAHLIRAVMEGIVFNMYSIGKVLMEKRNLTEIYATGGFTKSALWLQILCDMFNRKIYVSGAVESSAAGAVTLGMEAMGIEKKLTPKITDTYEPDALKHQIYQKQFEKFERIYDLLKEEMRNNEPIPVSAKPGT